MLSSKATSIYMTSVIENAQVESLWLLIRLPRIPRWLSHLVIGTVYNLFKIYRRLLAVL